MKFMEKYKNLGGNSNVSAFEIGPDYIKVRFNTEGSVYTYSNQSAGASHITRMKQLAQSGHGLNSYIQTHVRNNYVR